MTMWSRVLPNEWTIVYEWRADERGKNNSKKTQSCELGNEGFPFFYKRLAEAKQVCLQSRVNENYQVRVSWEKNKNIYLDLLSLKNEPQI